MKVWSDSFSDGSAIPGECAFCIIDAAHHVKLSSNRNPHIAWSEVPAGTRAFALICHDPDVPSKPDDLFKEDREVPASLPRVDFHHWVLIDIPVVDTGRRGRQLFEGSDAARQERARRHQRHAAGHQRLHRLVRERP